MIKDLDYLKDKPVNSSYLEELMLLSKGLKNFGRYREYGDGL